MAGRSWDKCLCEVSTSPAYPTLSTFQRMRDTEIRHRSTEDMFDAGTKGSSNQEHQGAESVMPEDVGFSNPAQGPERSLKGCECCGPKLEPQSPGRGLCSGLGWRALCPALSTAHSQGAGGDSLAGSDQFTKPLTMVGKAIGKGRMAANRSVTLRISGE